MSDPDFFNTGDEQLQELLRRLGITIGPNGEPDLSQFMSQAESMMRNYQTQMAGYGDSDAESGLNWGYLSDIARKAIDRAPAAPDTSAITLAKLRDAVGLADLWLDEEIGFPRLDSMPSIWDRTAWLEQTLPTWQALLRPVVTAMAKAQQGLIEPDATQPMGELWQPMMRMAANAMFGSQLGNALGELSTLVLSASDAGLPLAPRPQVVLLPENIAGYAEGLDAATEDLLLFLAIRESARERLFAAVGWLGPQLLALVQHYAADIEIDPDAFRTQIEERLGDNPLAFDPAAATGWQSAMEGPLGGLFSPTRTPQQDEVLQRLEVLLALVEGWVDEVAAQVTKPRMPAATALTEMLRRRSVEKGPVQIGLKTLVGIELSPRLARDAANLWAAVRVARGSAERDAVWRHPDLLPGVADLADPLGFAERGRTASTDEDFDSALAKLLDEEGPHPSDPTA